MGPCPFDNGRRPWSGEDSLWAGESPFTTEHRPSTSGCYPWWSLIGQLDGAVAMDCDPPLQILPRTRMRALVGFWLRDFGGLNSWHRSASTGKQQEPQTALSVPHVLHGCASSSKERGHYLGGERCPPLSGRGPTTSPWGPVIYWDTAW